MSTLPLFTLDAVDVHFHASSRGGGVRALVGVSLTFQVGERIALVGANGCGKSTLLRVLHGLVTPRRGAMTSRSGLRQAMLFQQPHMLRSSAQNNIAMGLWLQGKGWRLAQEQALLALQRVGLAEQAQRQARRLSGGQQQRLALARAWAMQPQVLLLDEPTASLDPHAKREVETLMAEFASGAAHGVDPMTLVFASHNLGQVKRLASRVIYLERGRMLADLPVHEFFDGTRLQQVSPAAQLFVKGELA